MVGLYDSLKAVVPVVDGRPRSLMEELLQVTLSMLFRRGFWFKVGLLALSSDGGFCLTLLPTPD